MEPPLRLNAPTVCVDTPNASTPPLTASAFPLPKAASAPRSKVPAETATAPIKLLAAPSVTVPESSFVNCAVPLRFASIRPSRSTKAVPLRVPCSITPPLKVTTPATCWTLPNRSVPPAINSVPPVPIPPVTVNSSVPPETVVPPV